MLRTAQFGNECYDPRARISPAPLLDQCLPALRYQTSLHHRQGATDHAVGARAHTRSRATPTRRASGEDAPAAGDRRTPLRYAKDEDGGDALPDEDAAAGRLRD